MGQTLEEKLTDLNTECASYKSQLYILKKEIEIHLSEICQLKDSNDSLKNQNESLKNQNDDLRTRQESFQQLSSTLDEMNNTTIDLQMCLDLKKEESSLLEDENMKLSAEIYEF